MISPLAAALAFLSTFLTISFLSINSSFHFYPSFQFLCHTTEHITPKPCLPDKCTNTPSSISHLFLLQTIHHPPHCASQGKLYNLCKSFFRSCFTTWWNSSEEVLQGNSTSCSACP